jgi:DNA-binding SARP family transcriptional activator
VVERERLRQLRLHALEALAVRAARERRFAVAVDAALEAVAVEPLRESSRRVLLEIHLAEGNVIEALRHFESFRDLLQAELGVRPSQRLTMLINAVVAVKVAPARNAPAS